jgi:hypothetical protein
LAFSPAPRLRHGLNRAAYVGANEYTSKLPSQWWAFQADDAALVVCAGEESRGPAVRTCRYTTYNGIGGPDTEQDVKPTAATVRAAFQPLVVRP